MRVVAGKYKGRRLAGPKGAAARPTSDKVREALFSILGDVSGLRVLDLFAGTGALGIEALSRGAGHVTFVERDRNMRAVAIANLQVIAADDPQAHTLRHEDAIAFLAHAAEDGQRFDLALLDPPYADAQRLAPRLAERLPVVLAPGAAVVAECDRRAPLMLESAGDATGDRRLALSSERRYGDTLLRFFRPAEAGA